MSKTIVVFLLSMLALSGSILVSFMNARSEASLGVHPSRIGGITIATRDIRLFILFVGSLFTILIRDALMWTMGILGIMAYFHVFLNLGIISRRYQIRRISSEGLASINEHTIGVVVHNDVCGRKSSKTSEKILGDN